MKEFFIFLGFIFKKVFVIIVSNLFFYVIIIVVLLVINYGSFVFLIDFLLFLMCFMKGGLVFRF